MMRKRMKWLFEVIKGIFILLAIGSGLAMILPDAVEKENKRHCFKLLRQSLEISRDFFFITPDEKEMCDTLNIKIYAPVSVEK